jgi:hypothetical protein
MQSKSHQLLLLLCLVLRLLLQVVLRRPKWQHPTATKRAGRARQSVKPRAHRPLCRGTLMTRNLLLLLLRLMLLLLLLLVLMMRIVMLIQ